MREGRGGTEGEPIMELLRMHLINQGKEQALSILPCPW